MHQEFQTENALDTFVGVWKRVVTDPRGFFADMPVRGGLANPLVFLLICLAVSAIGFLLIGPRNLALWFIIGGIIRAFIGAAVLMVIARQIFGGTGDYEATFRAVAYSSAPIALFWIPLIGPLAALYTLFLLILGLERVHAFDAVRSVLTVLLTAIVLATVAWVLGFPWWWHHHAALH